MGLKQRSLYQKLRAPLSAKIFFNAEESEGFSNNSNRRGDAGK
jgi:hypothetical protein